MSSNSNLVNFEEKRRLTIAPLFSVLALILSLLMIFYPFFKDRASEQKRVSKAKLESVAYQIVAFEKRKLANLDLVTISDRRPASLGKHKEVHSFGIFGAATYGPPVNYEIEQMATHLKVSVCPSGNLKARTDVVIPKERQ